MANTTGNNRANQGAKNGSSAAKTNTEKGCSYEKSANKTTTTKKTQG